MVDNSTIISLIFLCQIDNRLRLWRFLVPLVYFISAEIKAARIRPHSLTNTISARIYEILVKKDPALFLPSEIRFSGWERKQSGGMYCVRTVGAASALRARLLRSYVPLRRDRVKTCAITIHTSRRTLSQSDKSEFSLIL